MRIAAAHIAALTLILASQGARADDKPAPAQAPANSGVTVNLDAVPTTAKPHPKPALAQVHTPQKPLPRHKPTPAEMTAAIPFPRPKPQMTAAAMPHKAKPPEIGTESAPAKETALTTPQNAADIASAIRGTAMATPPAKAVDPTLGFSVLTRVSFRSGHSDLGDDAKLVLDALATRLLGNDERVRLAAFSGQPGDASSDAHRLSLARGLAVRTYLVGKGVPVDRVDVLAYGGSSAGAPDRVDVLVRALTHRTG